MDSCWYIIFRCHLQLFFVRIYRCPPGHGDIYISLLGSGMLDSLMDAGVKYLFVSNSDNLGATLDLKLLSYFASSNMSFLMEVRAGIASFLEII